jgi:hypothetical protein
MNAIPGLNINISVGGGVDGGMSPEFGNASFDGFGARFEPAHHAHAGAAQSAGGQGAGGTSNDGLAKDLLRYAEHVQDPKEKKQLIHAAMDLLGSSGSSSGANATPVSSDAAGASDGTDPTADDAGTDGTGSSSGQPVNVTVNTNGSNAPVNVTVNENGASQSSAGSSDATGNGALSVNGNSVDTGRYVITGSTDQDGSLKITDKQTGQTDTIWGDPHLDTSTGQHAEFQKDGLTINLPDGTRVEMKPTALDNGVAHLQGALISKGGDAVTMSGFTGGGGMQTSGVQQDSESLEQQYMTPNETVLDAGQDGVADLHYTNADGSMGAQLTSTDPTTSLDGAGGADPSGSTFGADGTGGAGSSDKLVRGLLREAANASSPKEQNQLIKAALDIMNDGASGTGGTGGAGGSFMNASDMFNPAGAMLNANINVDV